MVPIAAHSQGAAGFVEAKVVLREAVRGQCAGTAGVGADAVLSKVSNAHTAGRAAAPVGRVAVRIHTASEVAGAAGPIEANLEGVPAVHCGLAGSTRRGDTGRAIVLVIDAVVAWLPACVRRTIAAVDPAREAGVVDTIVTVGALEAFVAGCSWRWDAHPMPAVAPQAVSAAV